MISKYLTKSPTRGVYKFRRRVPTNLVNLWGKREVVQSLKTKDYSQALSEAARVNQNFEAKREFLTKQLRGEETQDTPEKVYYTLQEAGEFLRKYHIHPEQKPSYDASPEEIERYESWLATFNENYIDQKQIGHDPTTGQSLWKPDSPTDKWDQAKNIIEGKESFALEPDLTQALETYLKINQEKVQRTPFNQKKHEQACTRATDRLASFLGGGDMRLGYKFKLSAMTRVQVRKFRDKLASDNPGWSIATVNKDLQRLSAIFRLASEEFEQNLSNPFSNLKLEQSKRTKAKGRRSFTPDEMTKYIDALKGKHAQVRLIGMLMLATGARTMEIAGLKVDDLHLEANVPYISIRYNEIRNLKSDASERDVPVVGPALDLLRDHVSQLDDNAQVVFSRYGRDGGMESISQLLNRVIRKDLGISDRSLVAYSARHTLKDKLRAIRTPQELQHAILGHTSGNKIAEGYGTGSPLQMLQDELLKADNCKAWGK